MVNQNDTRRWKKNTFLRGVGHTKRKKKKKDGSGTKNVNTGEGENRANCDITQKKNKKKVVEKRKHLKRKKLRKV